VILAGIGQSFQAARIAKRALAAEGVVVRLVVEIGLYDLDPEAGDYLLSHAHIDGAARHSDVEDALGAVTCGADARCLGVLGAAQVDRDGNLNSTRLASGRLLVGSGGANDIASRAAEVVVLCPTDRLVPAVDFVTSPGRAVHSVVTDAGILTRARPGEGGWTGPAAAIARFQEP
jgi:citrate lyase alpha subunit